jgi:hypothetical protein
MDTGTTHRLEDAGYRLSGGSQMAVGIPKDAA